jgi:hypothetical protein
MKTASKTKQRRKSAINSPQIGVKAPRWYIDVPALRKAEALSGRPRLPDSLFDGNIYKSDPYHTYVIRDMFDLLALIASDVSDLTKLAALLGVMMSKQLQQS